MTALAATARVSAAVGATRGKLKHSSTTLAWPLSPQRPGGHHQDVRCRRERVARRGQLRAAPRPGGFSDRRYQVSGLPPCLATACIVQIIAIVGVAYWPGGGAGRRLRTRVGASHPCAGDRIQYGFVTRRAVEPQQSVAADRSQAVGAEPRRRVTGSGRCQPGCERSMAAPRCRSRRALTRARSRRGRVPAGGAAGPTGRRRSMTSSTGSAQRGIGGPRRRR